MKMQLAVATSRRALLLPLAAALVARPNAALAGGDRTTAQTVGVDRGSLLADPRDLGAEKGIVWGGRERCDPTDPDCTQGGVSIDSDASQPAPETPAGLQVTDRVRLAISIAGEPAGDITLGMWRQAAPNAVDMFTRLSRGVLTTAADEEPASLERSTALRVLRDQAIILGGLKKPGGSTRLVSGKTRPQRVPVAPPRYDDSNSLSHNAPGWLSVKRGGGSFEFVLTPRANPSLDKEWLVIGQVESGMELVERINTLPTNNYDRAPLATVTLRAVTVLSA